MDPDPNSGDIHNEYRYRIVIYIDRCLGSCARMVDRMVRGLQAEQEREIKTLRILRRR